MKLFLIINIYYKEKNICNLVGFSKVTMRQPMSKILKKLKKTLALLTLLTH